VSTRCTRRAILDAILADAARSVGATEPAG
jgi:hypothetical protein